MYSMRGYIAFFSSLLMFMLNCHLLDYCQAHQEYKSLPSPGNDESHLTDTKHAVADDLGINTRVEKASAIHENDVALRQKGNRRKGRYGKRKAPRRGQWNHRLYRKSFTKRSEPKVFSKEGNPSDQKVFRVKKTVELLIDAPPKITKDVFTVPKAEVSSAEASKNADNPVKAPLLSTSTVAPSGDAIIKRTVDTDTMDYAMKSNNGENEPGDNLLLITSHEDAEDDGFPEYEDERYNDTGDDHDSSDYTPNDVKQALKVKPSNAGDDEGAASYRSSKDYSHFYNEGSTDEDEPQHKDASEIPDSTTSFHDVMNYDNGNGGTGSIKTKNSNPIRMSHGSYGESRSLYAAETEDHTEDIEVPYDDLSHHKEFHSLHERDLRHSHDYTDLHGNHAISHRALPFESGGVPEFHTPNEWVGEDGLYKSDEPIDVDDHSHRITHTHAPRAVYTSDGEYSRDGSTEDHSSGEYAYTAPMMQLLEKEVVVESNDDTNRDVFMDGDNTTELDDSEAPDATNEISTESYLETDSLDDLEDNSSNEVSEGSVPRKLRSRGKKGFAKSGKSRKSKKATKRAKAKAAKKAMKKAAADAKKKSRKAKKASKKAKRAAKRLEKAKKKRNRADKAAAKKDSAGNLSAYDTPSDTAYEATKPSTWVVDAESTKLVEEMPQKHTPTSQSDGATTMSSFRGPFSDSATSDYAGVKDTQTPKDAAPSDLPMNGAANATEVESNDADNSTVPGPADEFDLTDGRSMTDKHDDTDNTFGMATNSEDNEGNVTEGSADDTQEGDTDDYDEDDTEDVEVSHI